LKRLNESPKEVLRKHSLFTAQTFYHYKFSLYFSLLSTFTRIEVGCFYIKGANCFTTVTSQIGNEFKFLYQKKLPEGMLYFLEDYSMMTSSDLMVVISILKQNNSDDFCEVEIVAGGGGEGIFTLNFGNEDRRINKLYKKINKLCESHNYKISEIVVSD